ncbi:ATP-dependent RNA helicase dbp6 [Vermiconidia calcicola]|uniref:ATP-dependent RNA helicase dbp6 n=1 Tax=Vermiconidia calcicola TaxID=1690605 RepID=A0ACC3NZ25_9PEZI|nr:ATP-dependent RNA helicase dbp6 [Vermiconidia calcicola]
MAPLYKRYIPPKASVASGPPPPVSSPKQLPAPAPKEEPKKRKRERTDEEVAERKAKKLRKKGIDPATVPPAQTVKATEAAKAGVEHTESTNGDVEDDIAEPRGEFAHIKNTKKRHKLEKEARNARKAAEKAQKVDGQDVGANGENPASHDDQRGHLEPGDSGTANIEQTAEWTQNASSEPANRKKRRKRDREEANAGVENGLTRDPPGTAAAAQSHQEEGRDEVKGSKDAKDLALKAAPAELQHDEAPSHPKKRRHKLESVLQEPQAEPPDGSADDREHLKRHGKILSKFQKSAARSQAAPPPNAAAAEEPDRPQPVLLDLAPLPQPEKAPTPEFVPDSSALPAWVAKPNVVSSESKASFIDLKLDAKTVEHLSKLGFSDALPVQQALIPLLLPPCSAGARLFPGTESGLPDVAVGAPTGSGKTIAYLLPIIESLRKTSGLGRLKALIVVPTRELVMQVAAVAESLAKGSSVKVGMATGSGPFKDEQAKLIKHGRKYDPDGYSKLLAKAHRQNYPPPQDTAEFEEYFDELEEQDAKEDQRVRDTVTCLIDHVPTYDSAVDILVATPGRLLEHLNTTLGFSLAYLEWLVLDEADKLLDLQYDGFLATINSELSRHRREEDEQDARERYLRSLGAWDERKERRVRKVVLSATMTRDVSKLVELRLRRPVMVVVRGEQGAAAADAGLENAQEGFELPPTLKEFIVPVGDGSEKPLFLVEVLRTRILPADVGDVPKLEVGAGGADERPASDPDAESGSSSDSSSEAKSESSSSSDEEQKDIETPEDEKDLPSEHEHDTDHPIHPDRVLMLSRLASHRPTTTPTILIFTSSTESATRLAHLLETLQPTWSPWITTMTKSSSRKSHASGPTEPIITISTDRAARGLDSLARPITHVIQYDVPRSATGYVHRVGRTARVGREGEAWTLYSHSEARWFMQAIVETRTKVRRVGGAAVEKVRVEVGDEGLRERFGSVVAGMRESVLGGKGRGK